MLNYLSNILPRLQRYSQQLDRTENFVGKKWLLIDEGNNRHSYEFLRDGRLVMSVVTNGTDQETRIGSWELLPSARLLVHRPEPLVLEQAFLGDGLLIFKESGTVKAPFSLYDPIVIPDGDVEKYVDKFLSVKESVQLPMQSSVVGNNIGEKKHRNSDGSLLNGEMQDTEDETRFLIVEKGVLTGTFYVRNYNTKNGIITIKQALPTLNKNDKAYNQDGSMVLNGVYKVYKDTAGINKITIVDGLVGRVENDDNIVAVMLIMIFIITAIIMYLSRVS